MIPAILLLGLGLALVVAEVLFPSFGVLSVLATIAIVAAVALAFRESNEAGVRFLSVSNFLPEFLGGSDLDSTELDLGARYTFNAGAEPGGLVFLPYVGLGVAGLFVDSGSIGLMGDTSQYGGYAHAGIGLLISNAVMVTLDLRTVFGTDSLDYTAGELGVGYSF